MKLDDLNAIELEEFPEIQEASERNLSMLRLYLKRVSVAEIAQRFGVAEITVRRAAKKGKWKAIRKRMDQRHYKDAMREVTRDLDAERALEKALGDQSIKRTEDGRYYYEVRVALPPGVKHYGIVPPAECCERIVRDGQLFIRTYITDAALHDVRLKAMAALK